MANLGLQLVTWMDAIGRQAQWHPKPAASLVASTGLGSTGKRTGVASKRPKCGQDG